MSLIVRVNITFVPKTLIIGLEKIKIMEDSPV